MIERLIENWLTSISEREFDVPFRLLLEQLGYIPYGRKTVHGMVEFGKDVVAIQKDTGLFHFFQIKSGDAELSDWNEMERQLRQLQEVPYVHPNYSLGDPYQPIWVITGQMQEAVRTNLGLEVDRYRREGRPAVEVWDQNTLIDYFKDILFNIPLADNLFLINYIRLWSRATDYLTDETEAGDFFRNYLALVSSGNQRERKNHLATFSLILAQISHRYLSMQDIYSAIDIVLLGLTTFSEVVVKESLPPAIYRATLDRLNELLNELLEDLVTNCESDNELFDLFDFDLDWHNLSEIFQLPLRIHSLASKVALSLILKSLKDEEFSREAEILKTILENNPTFSHFVSERQIGTLWMTIVGALKSEFDDLVDQLIAASFDWLLAQHAPGEKGLLSPYESYDEALKHLLDFTIPDTDVEMNRRGHTYILPVLMKLACMLDLRNDVEEHWHTIFLMSLADPFPTSEEALFTPFSEEVENLQMRFPPQASWTAIKEAFSVRLPPTITQLIDRHPELLLYLTLSYPWRTQWREFERYL